MIQYDKKDDYLEEIRNQISCKKAKTLVTEEIGQHIDDQRAAYEREGYEASTALAMAIEQMGNPVEVGIQLNKIHRPRLEWRILLTVFVLCCLGILAQLSLGNLVDGELLPNSVNVGQHVIFLIFGILLMTGVYFLDYTMIGKYSKLLCFLFLAGFFLFAPFNTRVNGSIRYLHAYGLLFLPIYGGLLYAYRKKGYEGIIKCLIISIMASLIEMRFVAQSSVYLGVLLSCMLLLSIAIIKNWFGTSKKAILIVLGGWLPFAYGILSLFHIDIFSSYQAERIQLFLNSFFHRSYYGSDYQIEKAKSILSHVKLFGGATGVTDTYLPGFNTEYILTYVINYWGIVAGASLIILFLGFIGRMLYLSYHQRNPLGMYVGLGCSLVFTLQGIIYIAANLGHTIVAQVNLPFVSYGGSSLIVNFIVLGLILSVFRNTSIIKEKPYHIKFAFHIEKETRPFRMGVVVTKNDTENPVDPLDINS